MPKSTILFIISGALLGLGGAALVHYGNPANMGVCAACFLRDTAGALGFHRAAVVQYIRPEIIGLIIGGFIASLISGEYRTLSASSPFTRFILGIFAMIGCLVFLGCPWRAFLRLGGGDMSAIAGVVGLFAGVACGRFFKASGYETERENELSKPLGAMPLIIGILLLLALISGVKFGENGAIFSSTSGPGSQHAPIFISLIVAIIIGAAMQRSKFCSVGALSRTFNGDFSMFWGIVAVIVSASIANLAFGQYKFGFEAQPIAHNEFIWNFAGMALAGLCFSLCEGCPGKHLVQAGSGNLNSAIFIAGMACGGAIAHNFSLASSAKGISEFAPYAVALGFAFCAYFGIFSRQKA
ncbi:MAG: YedE-related selenium metabolism membrane protein [Campylobacter sp.]|nr:YedE-related selenium metabolism membrane protein [Campylobacter sp.]